METTSKKSQATKFEFNATNINKKAIPADGGKRAVYWDTKLTGYGIRVLPSGSKTLFYQSRIDGELIRVTIGKVDPNFNAAVARKEALKISGEIAKGNDPRSKPTRKDSATFGDMMAGYVELLESRGKKDARAVKNQITKDIEKAFPKLWRKSATRIDVDDCLKIVKRLVDAGKLRQADKLRSYIRTAFSEAIKARNNPNAPASLCSLNIKMNPARDITKVEGSSNAKDRALSLSEFRAYWQHVLELPEPSRSIAMLHVLTGGQRQRQLSRVTLKDIDRDAPALLIQDFKGRRSEPRQHWIPLLPDALEAIHRLTGTGEYIFSCDGGKRPVHNVYLNDVVKRICAKMEEAGELEKGPFTAGSIRATVETRLSAKPYRVSSDVLGHLLSHGMGGVQQRHYQHHDFFDEKMEALEMLHRMVEGKPEPIAEVIPMRGRA